MDQETFETYYKLSHQQQRFCDLYLTHFNAFKAAVEAGYSENTSRKGALLHVPKIQQYLKEAMTRRSQRLEITHDMILRELSKIAFANMGNYYDEDAMIKPMNKLTVDEKAAIAYYDVFDHLDADGNYCGTQSKIKLHNKMAALDRIARHVGFYGTLGRSLESGVGSLESKRGRSPEPGVERLESERREGMAARAENTPLTSRNEFGTGSLERGNMAESHSTVVVDRSTNNLPMDYPEVEDDAGEIEGIDLKTLVALEDVNISPGAPWKDVEDEGSLESGVESHESDAGDLNRSYNTPLTPLTRGNMAENIENILTISPLSFPRVIARDEVIAHRQVELCRAAL